MQTGVFLCNNFKPTSVHSKTCFCCIDLATNLLSFHNVGVLKPLTAPEKFYSVSPQLTLNIANHTSHLIAIHHWRSHRSLFAAECDILCLRHVYCHFTTTAIMQSHNEGELAKQVSTLQTAMSSTPIPIRA